MKFREDSYLIGKDGKPSFGIHKSPLSELNIDEFRPHGKPNISLFERGWINGLRIKRWEYLGVISDDMVFGTAVVNLGYLSNMFAYIFDRRDKIIKEYNINQLLAYNTIFKGSIVKGEIKFEAKDTFVRIDNSNDQIHFEASINNEFKANLMFNHNIEPLSIVTRSGFEGFNYTNKEAGISVSGSLQLNDKTYSIDPSNPSGVVDFTLGYPDRRTFWNWVSGGGYDKKGRKLGFNFSQGVNETGFTENAFWIEGKLFKTDIIDFQYDDLHLISPWNIISNDGKINLTFHPEGMRSSYLNIGLIASRFQQPFGRFTGEIREGRSIYVFENVSGFTEEHFSKW